jgi:hypothetical protein
MSHFPADPDITEHEQQEPLLNESQDESLTLSEQPDSMTSSADVEDDKHIKSVIDVNEDESITPLLGNDDDNKSNINEVQYNLNRKNLFIHLFKTLSLSIFLFLYLTESYGKSKIFNSLSSYRTASYFIIK